jgi:hypothetical protein
MSGEEQKSFKTNVLSVTFSLSKSKVHVSNLRGQGLCFGAKYSNFVPVAVAVLKMLDIRGGRTRA